MLGLRDSTAAAAVADDRYDMHAASQDDGEDGGEEEGAPRRPRLSWIKSEAEREGGRGRRPRISEAARRGGVCGGGDIC